MEGHIIRSLAGALSATALAGTLGACAADQVGGQVPAPVTVSETGPCCGPVTPAGRHLLQVLDDSDVEHLWAKHRHVNWETGVPDRPAGYKGYEADTHCSAFAAAIGERLGVYMLRPPDHAQELLANAQAAWFGSVAGGEAGWRKVGTPEQAQVLANQGELVVVSYQSPDPHHSGHIGIVRPDARRTLEQIQENGVMMTQSGDRNYLCISAKAAFKWHRGAWPDGVKYFAYKTPVP
ncbi:MAG: hypothetical protein ABI135_06400 [Rhodoferax sp.]